MKLVLCVFCRDVVKMTPPAVRRKCLCGRSSGYYLTDNPADPRSVVEGEHAQIIAISNTSLFRIVRRVVKGKPDNFGRDHYVGRDDYWLKRNTLDAWVYGPNAREVTRNTTVRTPITESPVPAERARRVKKPAKK